MKACGRAKLTGVTPHVLRHTFASRLAMAGVGPAHHPRARRLAIAQDGRALRASLAEPQGRSRRANCSEFPDAIHDTAS